MSSNIRGVACCYRQLAPDGNVDSSSCAQPDTEPSGKSLVDIAVLNEFGSRPIVVRLTPKARAFLHAAFRHAGLDGPGARQPRTCIAVIYVPARPFLAPAFDKYAR